MLALALMMTLAQAAPDPHRPPPRVDSVAPALPKGFANGVLIVSKTNGWRHLEHIPHSNALFRNLAQAMRRPSFVTENAAIFAPDRLARTSVVVLNSASGAFATEPQRAALRRWVEAGGGIVAVHASGDGSHAWPWWIDDVIGARFTGHPGGDDHIQAARLTVTAPDHPVMAGVAAPWSPRDEWYSFDRVPVGATILATIDEASYRPDRGKEMGTHPVAWARHVGRGRVVYLAQGHTPEAYDDPNFRRMLANAMRWVAR